MAYPFKNWITQMTPEDWEKEAEAIKKSAERQQFLEAIAACLQNEGLAALPQRRPGEIATTYILICTTRYLIGLHETDITITIKENPLAQIPLADPQVFKKAKEVIKAHYHTKP